MSATHVDLFEHEAKGLTEKRLGVLVRIMDPQPVRINSAQYTWKGELANMHGDPAHFWIGPFVPGAVLGCREPIIRSEDGWWGRYEADGAWVTSQPPSVPARICWWSRKDRSLAPSQKTERLSAEQCPNFAIRFRVTVGEVGCVRACDVELGDWLKAGYLPSMWDFHASREDIEAEIMKLWEDLQDGGKWGENPWLWIANIQPTE